MHGGRQKMASVRVGGLEFHGGAGQDGFYIEGEGLQGLLSGVDVKRDSVSRPQSHGDFDVPGYLEARIVSLAGPCIAESAEVLAHRGRQLTGLLADGGSLPVTFDVPGGPLWGTARLADKTEFDVSLWGSRAQYNLRLLFANPRLLGESRTAGAFSPAFNYGNFPATPIHTVVGTSPAGYTIGGPDGKQYIVTQPLVAGSPHVIDMATGYLTINGATIFGGVSRADTWAIPGGGNFAHTLNAAVGTLTLATTITDTYV